MPDHSPLDTSGAETPIGIQMARDGLELMTETQRIALAIEIVEGAEQPRSQFDVQRLMLKAGETALRLLQARVGPQ